MYIYMYMYMYMYIYIYVACAAPVLDDDSRLWLDYSVRCIYTYI